LDQFKDLIANTKQEDKDKLLKFIKSLEETFENNSLIYNPEVANEPIAQEAQRKLWVDYELTLTRSGLPVKNENNIVKIFKNDVFFKDAVYYDEFHRSIFIKDCDTGVSRKIRDDDFGLILMNLQSYFGLSTIALNTVRTAIEIYAGRNRKDEVAEYLNGVEWDGIERLDKFFTNYCGAPNKTYERTASRNWWISIVARGLRPGSKVDNMVILEGAQGIKKSTMLEVIGGKWYAENTAEIGDKDFYQNLEGVLISEIAELDSFSKAGVTTIKRVITSIKDKYRPSYGRSTVEFPRRNVFVGTTNDTEYLKDETGNRRFWPIACTKIDLNRIKEDRDQLFAEAVSYFKAGESWWSASDVTHEVQESRRQKDPWEDIISDWIVDRRPFRIDEILKECLNLDHRDMHKGNSNRVGKILKSIGFENAVINSSRRWRKIM